MGIEALKTMKEQLMSCVQGQLNDISKVDAKQLGEAIDMIKDLSEAAYYCTITEAMEKTSNEDQKRNVNLNYYTPMYYGGGKYPMDAYRDVERHGGYMYYPGGSGNASGGHMGGGSSDMNYYTEIPMDMMRDPREGRAGARRRTYMEGKEMHKDPKSQMKELEAYLQELSTDITEMIRDASPEERATLHQKMTMLANKIS